MSPFIRPALLWLSMLLSGGVMASPDRCNAGPRDQWQPIETLEKRLRSEGWTIRKSTIHSGCYKIRGKSGKGMRMKAYFNPKTLEILKDE
ncbi:MAG: PepSY domain-containing protein [Burkholderiaceae bacterium]